MELKSHLSRRCSLVCLSRPERILAIRLPESLVQTTRELGLS